jgi:hydroxyacyl-ACP dehydratase HTD2-like protein with hotdog domain
LSESSSRSRQRSARGLVRQPLFMSEEHARALVSKMAVHDQRHLMYVEKTFIPPKLKEGEKPPEGVNSTDLPRDQVYKLAVKAMQKRLERGLAMPLPH